MHGAVRNSTWLVETVRTWKNLPEPAANQVFSLCDADDPLLFVAAIGVLRD
jgi:hypothetical protein